MLFGSEYLSIIDIILPPIYIFVFITILHRIKEQKIEKNPEYYFFIKGGVIKLFASIIFCLIYTLYYGGGDTTNYFVGAKAYVNVLYQSGLGDYLAIVFGEEHEGYSLFSFETGYPRVYMWRDYNSRFVMSFVSFLLIFSFKSYVTGSLLLAFITYFGVWKLFLFLYKMFPMLKTEMATSVLYVPSVIFWGSGIGKDGICLAAASWFIYSIYRITSVKKSIPINVLMVIVCGYVLIGIKPYILLALIPGAVIWVMFDKIIAIRNVFIRVFIMPFIIVSGLSLILYVFSSLSGSLGAYSTMDAIVEKAQITQQDLTRADAYGENYYDIGEIDGTFSGMISKMPVAIVAGLYRPFIWESNNPVMAVSGIENLIIMSFSILVVIRYRFKLVSAIFKEPVLIFCLSFSLFFSFAIGLSTANFGALVRYKIPAMPFFMASLFIVNYLYLNKKGLFREKTSLRELFTVNRLQINEKDEGINDEDENVDTIIKEENSLNNGPRIRPLPDSYFKRNNKV